MKEKFLKYIYITLGTISLVLGILGFVVPGLPRTPFFLLTAYLYMKGSPRLHQWVLNNKVIGPYIKKVDKGFSLKATLLSIGFMWVMIGITVFIVFKNHQTMQLVMVGAGLVGTVVQFIVLRRKKVVVEEEKAQVEEVADI